MMDVRAIKIEFIRIRIQRKHQISRSKGNCITHTHPQHKQQVFIKQYEKGISRADECVCVCMCRVFVRVFGQPMEFVWTTVSY